MTKLFLILLLITKHSVMMFLDWEPEIFKGIRYEADFSKLTPAQEMRYAAQVEYECPATNLKPIECAALCGDTDAVRWLLSKRVNLSNTKALKIALNPIASSCIKSELISGLLTHGVTTSFMIDGKNLAAYMQAKLTYQLSLQKAYPCDMCENICLEIKQTESLLRRHDDPLLWAWIKVTVVTRRTIDSRHVKILNTRSTKKAKS